MTSRMSEEDKAHTRIETLRCIVGKLGTIGAPVTDDQYKMALLRSLPKSFENLVVTLENLMDNLSIQDIHARIIREEARRARCKDGDDATTNERILSTRDKICSYCGKKGHLKSQCWKMKAKRRAQTNSGSKNGSTKRHGGN